MAQATIDVTAEEIMIAKRAVVVFSEVSQIAVAATGKKEPIEIKSGRLGLIKLIRKLKAAI